MISKELHNLISKENLGDDVLDIIKKVTNNDTLLTYKSVGEKYHFLSMLDGFVLIVAKDSFSSINVFNKMKSFYAEAVTLYQPNDDLLIYRKNFQKSTTGSRIKALCEIASGKIKCCVTSPQALVQFVPDWERLKDLIVDLKIGENVDMYELIDTFVKLGYEKENTIEEKNTFSVSGDTISIFLTDMDYPVRISFFDDVVEEIKMFDPETMMTTKSLKELIVYPNNDLLFTPDEIEQSLEMAKKELKTMSTDASIRCEEIISDLYLQKICSQKMQWLIPFLRDKMKSLFSYLPDNAFIVFDEVSGVSGIVSDYIKENESRIRSLLLDGEVTKKHKNVILDRQELKNNLENFRLLGFSGAITSNLLFEPKQIIKLPTVKLNNYLMHYDSLIRDLQNFAISHCMIVICQASKERAKALQVALNEAGAYCSYTDVVPSTFVEGTFVTSEDLVDGFFYSKSKIVVIGNDDIARKKDTEYKRNKNSVFVMPKVGDYVVHEVQGIGRCLGTNRIKTGNIEKDYIIIEYKNNALFYLPVEQMDKLSRYSGSDVVPTLSVLGGTDFEKVKAKVRSSVKKMAFSLVELYSKRSAQKGFKYPQDDEFIKEFEDAFEFTPTPDQVDAVIDIKSDMERGLIMDRLLCGDVGYGKTEVALRAIFKTIMSGKQAAILAPTTILVHQHYKNAIERFKNYGIGIEVISRLRTKQEIEQSLENIKEGKSQLVIATHRILSKDVCFKDLGLLVLDEEQRFGVEHKEKLKTLKNNLNVLTLSATPIPRTLNMSLIGVRDISVLESPPVNRIPVQTSVTELTNGLIEDCITREMARGGQVFILYNHVESIVRFSSDVANLVPNARIVVAHGQMPSDTLEDRINDFYEKRADVLICTTIIENGIDIPDANTLIVCDADHLGLSQLYQLRGRVGRSDRLAYAFFTVPQGKILTETASKRLAAIMDYTELGSGFKIAMRDLEIRGAGNILGREQHGHIEKVGYDLYCKILQQAVDELKGVASMKESSCRMEVDVNAYLDNSYINNDNARLRLFRDVLDIKNLSDEEKMIAKIKESFGELPNSLVNLIDIGLVRNISQELGIVIVRIKTNETSIIFEDANFMNNTVLIDELSKMKDKISIKNEERPKIVFNLSGQDNIKKLHFMKEFMLKLV